MSANLLYQQLVLEHQRSPRHYGAVDGATHGADGANALCGDHVHVEARMLDGRIAAMGFTAEACAITTAAASMLGACATGMSDADLVQLERAFAAYLRGDSGGEALPGDLAALGELRRYPARRQCALLPFTTLRAALAGIATTTTEKGNRMSSVYQFRAATADDVAAIVVLVESAYRGEVSKQGWTTEADMLDGRRTDPEGVAAIIDKPGSRVLLAAQGGALLACCHIEKQGDAGYFGMFSVAPAQQGGGIGKAVLAEAERIAHEEWQCARMEMTVIDIRDELIAWYERRGYRRTGIKKPFPYGDARFGIPKRDDLRFEILSKTLAGRS